MAIDSTAIRKRIDQSKVDLAFYEHQLKTPMAFRLCKMSTAECQECIRCIKMDIEISTLALKGLLVKHSVNVKV